MRKELFIILSRKNGSRATVIFSWVLTLMVLANVMAVILESIPSLHEQYRWEFHAFELFSVVFFLVEYLCRIWVAPEQRTRRPATPHQKRLRYIFSFHGIVDFLAIVPFFLQAILPGLDLRFLRIVRILRLLKLSHYNTALEDLIAAIVAERNSFISALYLLAIALLTTSCLIYYAEHNIQPDKFGTIPDALWWSIVTLTTLGYGDAVPVSGIGKLVGGLTALSGVFTVALLTGIVASAFTTWVHRQEIELETEIKEALSDGHFTAAEEATIERLRKEYGLSVQHAQEILNRLREDFQKSSGSL